MNSGKQKNRSSGEQKEESKLKVEENQGKNGIISICTIGINMYADVENGKFD